MKLSTIRKIRTVCSGLHSDPDWREVVTNIDALESDFEVDGVRFISSSAIDQIQTDELEADLYCLGCFNANFLAGVLEIDPEVIEAMQTAEAYEAIGKLIVSMRKLGELQHAYSSADGYGHHFNHYDFSEEELRAEGETYHVFDNH